MALLMRALDPDARFGWQMYPDPPDVKLDVAELNVVSLNMVMRIVNGRFVRICGSHMGFRTCVSGVDFGYIFRRRDLGVDLRYRSRKWIPDIDVKYNVS